MSNYTEDPFAALYPRLCKGDSAAEEAFFHHAHGYLMVASRRFPQIREADREDFILEVIERVLTRLDSFCLRKASFRTWIHVVSRNLAFDKGRRQRDGRDVMHGALDEEATEWHRAPHRPAEEPDEEAGEERWDLESLSAALARMEPMHRQLLLDLSAGRSAREVAEELNLTHDNVRKLYQRLKQRLRDELGVSFEA
jgi:RNA polymerase sigma factor (sigma-70 family)